MSFFDKPLEELQRYLPERNEPDDYAAFWAETLSAARAYPLNPIFEPIDIGLGSVDTYDVTFNGFGGQPIKGWFLRPKHAANAALPCLVEYIGYGSGRGALTDWLLWSSVGVAHFVMDNRGQTGYGMSGNTPDIELEGSNPQHPGFMTRGILNPRTYYYRRLMTDVVRAVEAAQYAPGVDLSRIGVTGGSQGGGLALSAAGLSDQVKIVLSTVPFLCHYRHATQIQDMHPYREISQYLLINRDHVARVFQTLAYFDGVNFAAHATAKAIFSVGLMDEICPPSTVYAAYNYYKGEKQIHVYEYNHHEGGGSYHVAETIKFVRAEFNL